MPGRVGIIKIVEGVVCSIVTLVALKGQIKSIESKLWCPHSHITGEIILGIYHHLKEDSEHVWELKNSIQFPIAEAILYDA